ncbi:MAG: enoyl-CoA hydratase/isomerase family protein [Proteobacteria bacterium]|nr:enoyl-CoA hydratase/isomerase family protein [Pseudomonadota bacterium]HQR03542.1 crotonase/enoyl-CoA hydratase family protein [Rhodocyclaceae bacterium]
MNAVLATSRFAHTQHAPATEVPRRIAATFEPDLHSTLWVAMTQDPQRQNFSIPLLRQLGDLLATVSSQNGCWVSKGDLHAVNYVVLRSEHPEFFSMGGDLTHFHERILAQDWDTLYAYSKYCLDTLYAWATALNGSATTISLVQGRALGGGFETALAADHIIAEEHSEFGFPEIMFGMFPCTGGMSLLARRIGAFQAEKMLTNAKMYSAQELLALGVIDEVCERGAGELAVEAFVKRHQRHREARLMVQRSRQRVSPLDYDEMHQVVHDWVLVAQRLTPEELRTMEMLAQLQSGR